jgi:hypothetical protein
MCFGLDLDEQDRSGFTYSYSVYQAEYSRNLIFTVGAQMDKVFNRIVDRTRARLDVPTLRTLFGAKQRPSRTGSSDLSLQLAAMIETPRYDLTLFKSPLRALDAEGLTQPHRQRHQLLTLSIRFGLDTHIKLRKPFPHGRSLASDHQTTPTITTSKPPRPPADTPTNHLLSQASNPASIQALNYPQ